MSRRLLLVLAVGLGCAPLALRGRVHADVRSVQSVTAIVGPHSLTRDTDGDGLDDAVAARVIVPASPTRGDAEAATNVAARLAYDTTALTLPLVVRDGDVAQPASFGVPILELRWPQARQITIQRPTFPDPLGGRSRESFISTAPPNITVESNDTVNAYGDQFNGNG